MIPFALAVKSNANAIGYLDLFPAASVADLHAQTLGRCANIPRFLQSGGASRLDATL
jgi:hypothetical protein